MVRWLESNGYDVSYTTGVDTERRGNLITAITRCSCPLVMTNIGPAGQRTNVEAARNAGVHLAFLSGNEMFWKTRWENGIAQPTETYRTLVCYKETHANAKIDPIGPTVWTGTWRDPRFSPPADGGRPENALSGTIFTRQLLHEWDSDDRQCRSRQAPLLAKYKHRKSGARRNYDLRQHRHPQLRVG